MLGRKTINKKVTLFAVVVVMFVAALFVISIANSASAFTLQGKVAAIDSGGKTFTLQEDRCGMSGQYGFTLDDRATVMRGDGFVPFNDIKVGDDVIVTYYESSGLYVAEDINIPAMLLPHC